MENKKQIWIINQYVTRYEDSGGSRHLDFASEWVKKGYEVHIFASGFHYNEYKEKIVSSYKLLVSSENSKNYKLWAKDLYGAGKASKNIIKEIINYKVGK